jgi:histidinol-phosphatase (PHP family)
MNDQLNVFTKDSESMEIARNYGLSKILTIYFDTLIEAVQILPGTVLCHLDGALRHLPELSLTDSHVKQIDQLLQLLAKKKILLEINSSGIRMRGEQFPSKIILEMATSYNIKLRLGSDAHKPEDVGYEFDFFRKKYC